MEEELKKINGCIIDLKSRIRFLEHLVSNLKDILEEIESNSKITKDRLDSLHYRSNFLIDDIKNSRK